MEYSLVYLVIITIVIIAAIRPNSKFWSVVVLLAIFSLFAFSHDLEDYNVYRHEYNAIGNLYSSGYEFMFVLFSKIGNHFNLSFYQFRIVLVAIELSIFWGFVHKNTEFGALVLALYLIYSAIFDAITLRHFMASIPTLFALRFLQEKEKKGNIIKYLILISIAGLCHSSFWVFLVFLPFSYIGNKKKIIVAVIALIFVYLTASTGIVFRIYSLLPIRESTISKYDSNTMANLNGIIENCVKQFICMLPAVYVWFSVEKKPHNLSDSRTPLLDLREKMLNLNITFCILLPFQVFAVNFSRMQRLLVIWNYIFMMMYLKREPKRRLEICVLSIIYALLVLFITMITSSTNWEYVWFMHLETNPVLQFFKL